MEKLQQIKDIALSRHIWPHKDVDGTQGKIDLSKTLEIPDLQSGNHNEVP